jgi:catechol 2,3-dioxygenase-like lactoylglutathione lyase family enzyme
MTTAATSGQPLADPPVAGVPTARRVDHVAFTVPDLDVAVRFLVDVLGGALVYRLPPLSRDDNWMADKLDVHPRATAEIALVRLGPVTNVELFEYSAPDHDPHPPRPCDVGSHHLGLFVDDVEAAARRLADEPGVHLFGPVRTVPPGLPDAGAGWLRVLAPWGMQLELRSVPAALPYERHTAARRFGPCPAWQPGKPGVPGIRNVDHLAYTVADLDAAVGYFVDVLGAELLYRAPRQDLAVDGLAAALGVPASGTVERVALRMGPTDNVELYRYRVPGARTVPPRNSDVGGRHLAIYVDDVDRAADYMAACPGTTVLGTPETITDGPIAGDRWVYVRTPVGLHVELVRMPDGSLPYEAGTAARRCSAKGLRWWDR